MLNLTYVSSARHATERIDGNDADLHWDLFIHETSVEGGHDLFSVASVSDGLQGHQYLIVLVGLTVVGEVSLEDGDDFTNFALQSAGWVGSAVGVDQ